MTRRSPELSTQARATADSSRSSHHEELALPIREIGKAHVAAGIVDPRCPYVHVAEQVGDVDRFERREHLPIVCIGAGKASSAVA